MTTSTELLMDGIYGTFNQLFPEGELYREQGAGKVCLDSMATIDINLYDIFDDAIADPTMDIADAMLMTVKLELDDAYYVLMQLFDENKVA